MQSSHEIVPVADFLNSLGDCKRFPRIFLNFVANQIPEILLVTALSKINLNYVREKENELGIQKLPSRGHCRASTNNATTICVWLYLPGVGSITMWHRAYLSMSFLTESKKLSFGGIIISNEVSLMFGVIQGSRQKHRPITALGFPSKNWKYIHSGVA